MFTCPVRNVGGRPLAKLAGLGVHCLGNFSQVNTDLIRARLEDVDVTALPGRTGVFFGGGVLRRRFTLEQSF